MSIRRRYLPLTVTVPANTAKASPITVDSGVANAVVNTIELRIPPGHGGLTGISVQWNGVSVVPFAQPPEFIDGDDDFFTFDVGEQIGGGLTVAAFNTDPVNPHSFFLRFDVTPFVLLSSFPATSVSPVPIA
ncbi:MAG TPA: hypothetical protein VKU86_10480 [Acidimicrobiales bacterium]|nr:hypothetical protein [Acidimicrobiales bacterium]